MPLRAPHPKTIVVAALSVGLIALLAYFLTMDLVVLPRAEATLDRAVVRLEARSELALGERGTLVIRLDNRANREAVRFRDVVVTQGLADALRFDGEGLRAQGAIQEGARIVWNREVPGGGETELVLPFQAKRAGRHAGALFVLCEVPRMTKGRSFPLTLEVRETATEGVRLFGGSSVRLFRGR